MFEFFKNRWALGGALVVVLLVAGGVWFTPIRSRVWPSDTIIAASSLVDSVGTAPAASGGASLRIAVRAGGAADPADQQGPDAVLSTSTGTVDPAAIPVTVPVVRTVAGHHVVNVLRGSIAESLRLFGRVVPEEEKTVVAPLVGKAASLDAKVGQTVRQGQLLMKVDPDPGAKGDPVMVGLVRAPTSGTITQVKVHEGDALQFGQMLLIIATPGDPVLRVELADEDLARVSVGQSAKVKDVAGGAPSDGLIVYVSRGQGGKPGFGLVQVDWPGKLPDLGSVLDVQVVVQVKDGVLLVPAKAVHSLGGRHFVEYMDGTDRRRTAVKVGIVAEDNAEITAGLTEGQSVLVVP